MLIIGVSPTPPLSRTTGRSGWSGLAGGAKPSLRARAVALATERGVVKTRELTNIGIPGCYLVRVCDEGLLIKVDYGLYRAGA